MFEATLNAIRAAQLELKKRDRKGRVVIELEPEQWAAFKYGMDPAYIQTITKSSIFEMRLHGGIVRQVRQGATDEA